VRRTLLVLGVVAVLVVGLGAFLTVHRFGSKLPIPTPIGRACEVGTGSDSVKLNSDQIANAATIAAVGLTRGLPDRAVVVALATALQESKLVNLAGGDRDSVGLFQQRPSMGWGTAEQIQDPRYAAAAFYNQLIRVRGWQEMRITQAAQAVQRSAFPEAYDAWVVEAQVLGMPSSARLRGLSPAPVRASQHFGARRRRRPSAWACGPTGAIAWVRSPTPESS
jgi:hypothetical protein